MAYGLEKLQQKLKQGYKTRRLTRLRQQIIQRLKSFPTIIAKSSKNNSFKKVVYWNFVLFRFIAIITKIGIKGWADYTDGKTRDFQRVKTLNFIYKMSEKWIVWDILFTNIHMIDMENSRSR